MPKSDDLQIPHSKFSVGICYKAEKIKNGIHDDSFKDLIVLKENKKIVLEVETKMPITVGRISGLTLENSSDKFISVSYDAGEFCNGIIVFNSRNKTKAFAHGCFNYSDVCHVQELNDSSCKLTIECKDQGSEGDSPKKKEPTIYSFNLCNGK